MFNNNIQHSSIFVCKYNNVVTTYFGDAEFSSFIAVRSIVEFVFHRDDRRSSNTCIYYFIYIFCLILHCVYLKKAFVQGYQLFNENKTPFYINTYT